MYVFAAIIRRVNTWSSVDASKRQFLHQQVHALIHFKTVQVVWVAQQPHQQTAERHVGGAKTQKSEIRIKKKKKKRIRHIGFDKQSRAGNTNRGTIITIIIF